MNNFSNIYITGNLFYNETVSSEKICELNQLKMLESVQKFPKIVFYLILLSFSIYFCYMIYTALSKNKERIEKIANIILNLQTSLTAIILYFATFTTFNAEKVNTLAQSAIITLILILGVVLYLNWKRKWSKKYIGV